MSLQPELRQQGDAVAAPATGVPAVDGVLEAVAGLGERPLSEHAEIFSAAHETLRRALDDVEEPATDIEPA